jgi:hypothetical protein
MHSVEPQVIIKVDDCKPLVTGHTIYNALQIAELETEGDRPVEPFPKILKAEVGRGTQAEWMRITTRSLRAPGFVAQYG